MILLYDQDVNAHFPPHYKNVYEDIIKDQGGRLFCYTSDDNPDFIPEICACVTAIRSTLLARIWIAAKFFVYALRDPKRLRKETIMVHDDIILALSAYFITRIISARFIYRISQIKPESRAMRSGVVIRQLTRIMAYIRNVLMKRSNAVVLMSEEMHSYFVHRGVRNQLTEVVPSCVDTSLYGRTCLVDEQYEAIRQKLQAFERVLVYVGNINLARGVGLLAPTVAALNSKCPTAILFVGARAQVSECRRLERSFAQEGVGSSFFATNKIPEERLEPYVRLGQVGVSVFAADTIYRVNSPLKILNYLASGIPFVGTNTLDQQTLARETGFGVIADMTVESFVEAIETAQNLPNTRDAAKATDWVKQHRDLSAAKTLLLSVIERLDGEDFTDRVIDV